MGYEGNQGESYSAFSGESAFVGKTTFYKATVGAGSE